MAGQCGNLRFEERRDSLLLVTDVIDCAGFVIRDQQCAIR